MRDYLNSGTNLPPGFEEKEYSLQSGGSVKAYKSRQESFERNEKNNQELELKRLEKLLIFAEDSIKMYSEPFQVERQKEAIAQIKYEIKLLK